MTSNFLEKILYAKRRRVDALKATANAVTIRERALAVRRSAKPNAFSDILRNTEGVNIIAEIKRSSPSKGVINDKVNVAEIAHIYESGGARALSVLTEEDFFDGSLSDLIAARRAVSLPILRKDFVVDEFQIYEAAEAGADAVLLIVAALSETELSKLLDTTEHILGMDALVEVHDSKELESAVSLGCRLIGVNNRSLHTFDVSLDVSRKLILNKPHWALMISESGITSPAEIEELGAMGFDGYLVGEALMRSDDPRKLLSSWI